MQHRNPSKEKIPRDPIWYPFTQMKPFLDESPLAIVKGEGNWLIDKEGRRYLDGVSSLWANLHGHCHPRLNQALHEQIDHIAHTTMLGLTHPWGIELARRLVAITPEGLTRVFYSDSGATAVEIAIKMAFQYWQLRGEHQRRIFFKLGEAYHGDTVGAVSVGGMEIFHERFRPLLFPTVTLPSPDLVHPSFAVSESSLPSDSHIPSSLLQQVLDKTESLLRRHADEACAVIVEPLIQGAAGMIVHPPGYLRQLRELTHRYRLLLIADEVAVGFGRTGAMFACEWEGVAPDLLCLGKGLSGGYLPLAATLATEEIFSAFLGEFEELKTFFHGHTYTGNPLACKAALASLDVFEEEQTLSPAVFGPKAKRYAEGMHRLFKLPHVGSCRWRGLMGGIELVEEASEEREDLPSAMENLPFGILAKKNLRSYSWKKRMGHHVCMNIRHHNVILRPLGDVVVILPPLSISLEELDHLFHALELSIREVCD